MEDNFGYGKPLFAVAFCMAVSCFLPARAQDKPKADTIKPGDRTEKFYDSVYQKFHRNKLASIIYPLAFRPKEKQASNSLNVMQRTESRYMQYKGRIIRNIHVHTLAPFGYSVYDSAFVPRTGSGRALNGAHVTTQNYVIRRELIFKKGQRIDPELMAENERNIRGLPEIDNVNFIITPISPGSDSVDILVVTKDVWSIGATVSDLTSDHIGGSIYDANFMGLGDRLTLRMSMEGNRAPFFMINGISYAYTNIGGSFIDAVASYTRNNKGSWAVSSGFQRNFFSYTTRWAGNAVFTLAEDVEDVDDSVAVTSRYHQESAWLGVSFPLERIDRNTRFIMSGSVTNHFYLDRPMVTAESNQQYYNYIQFLGQFSLSTHKYYTGFYVTDFGRPENIPYGKLIQVTLGPQFTEFDVRFYTGMTMAAGKFFGRFGYLSGTVNFGGFFDRNVFQDGVVRANLSYFTNLYQWRPKGYMSRFYFRALYGFGFNRTPGNVDYSDLNNVLEATSIRYDTLFQGSHNLAMKISSTIYTPWYFYGFKFALSSWFQTGIFFPDKTLDLPGDIYAGIGVGLMIRNENLIFPTFLVSFTVYPGNQPGISTLQVDMRSDITMGYQDFSVKAPKIVTLHNGNQ